MKIPNWWQFVLLLLGLFRLVRLTGWDDVTLTLRRRLTGLGDTQHHHWAHAIDKQREAGFDPWTLTHDQSDPDSRLSSIQARMEMSTGSPDLPSLVVYAMLTQDTAAPPVSEKRFYLSSLVRCPWCVSVWLAVPTYLAWELVPHFTLAVCFFLALSAGCGLLAKNLDP